MFEFEKQIMKSENKYPMIGYPYKVVPISKMAKLAFAKWLNHPHRIIPEKEMKSFIEKNLNLDHYPFVGEVKLYEDIEDVRYGVEDNVIKRLSLSNVTGIDYNDPHGTLKHSWISPLECRKDFIIEIGEPIIYEQSKSLTFDDIKAL